MLDDLELDVFHSESWTHQALTEAKRDAQLEKATADLDRFFEKLEITPDRTGCAKLTKADMAAILGEPDEELPQPSAPDPWAPVKTFVKAEKAKLRGRMTTREIRNDLSALAQVLERVANGNL